jgi:hypothetical protein
MIMNEHELSILHTAQFNMTQKLKQINSHAYVFDHEFYKGYPTATSFYEATQTAQDFVTRSLPTIDQNTRKPDPRMYDLGNMIDSIYTTPPSTHIPSSDDLLAIKSKLKKNNKDTCPEWDTEPKRTAWIAKLTLDRDTIVQLSNQCHALKNILYAAWTKVTDYKWKMTLGKKGAFANAHLQDSISLQTPYTLTEMRLLLPQC